MKKFTELGITKDIISSSLLFLGVLAALLISNNEMGLKYYREFISINFYVGVESFQLNKPLLKWVNDGLMAIFFFLLGLEMKYHIIQGEFSNKRNLILPSVAAVGGFIVPALVYNLINIDNPEGARGWAIPVATDTAFVLAIISFFGKRIADNIKVFLIGLSIIDDVFAVIALALFYTPNLDIHNLALCALPLLLLAILNIAKTASKWPYYLSGFILWIFTVNSGVHGTIAGVAAALFIPTVVTTKDQPVFLVKKIQKSAHNLVAFFVLPLFAFVNCELPFNELSMSDLTSKIALGSFFGLAVGKALGIYGFSYVAIKLKLCYPLHQTSKLMYLGLSFLCGIGFTLSLFIGLQAFDSLEFENQMKIGVLLASLFTSIVGAFIIYLALKQEN